jgi:hypothetical protein
MDGLNYGTYYFFRNLARETPLLRTAMCAVDFLGTLPVLALVAVIVLTLLIVRGNRRGALVVTVAVIFGLLVIEGVNWVLGSPRPPEADASYGALALGPSFASRTGFLSLVVYGVLGLVLGGAASTATKRLAIFAGHVLLVLAIGFSQLYLSLEFLTALLAGWAAGAFALLLCWQLAPLGAPEPR